jgi:hypothetical protein
MASIRSRGRLLWTRQCAFGINKWWGIYQAAEPLSTSQKGLCFMELVAIALKTQYPRYNRFSGKKLSKIVKTL